MRGPARIVIQMFDGETVVHEFRRATAQPTGDGIRRMTESAQGWLQAYGSQVTDEQWRDDADRARYAQQT